MFMDVRENGYTTLVGGRRWYITVLETTLYGRMDTLLQVLEGDEILLY